MAHVLTSVKGSQQALVPIRRALLSVSDKRGLPELGKYLASIGCEILSTGGTARKLREAGLKVVDVADFTGAPEMLDGRVKTLHPKIHGGILAVRGNDKHESEMKANDVKPIDAVVVNLYPFKETVAKGHDFATCVENIDIGGPSMLRSSAKNHASVVVVTSPDQYGELISNMKSNGGKTTPTLRRQFAAAAFEHSAKYDAAISAYFQQNVSTSGSKNGATKEGDAPSIDTSLIESVKDQAVQLGIPADPRTIAFALGFAASQQSGSSGKGGDETVTRAYTKCMDLKYGCNPHQKPAALYRPVDSPLPFTVLNGKPGYINTCDATNAWQLVRELRQSLNLPAATSFKHVSPAGAAVAVPLSDTLAKAYEAKDGLSEVALAYLRARNADPMSSFGDFCAVSDKVDVSLAKLLKYEVSDGIIAPDYEPEALKILSAKKGGKFIVLKGDPKQDPPAEEFRELHGAVLMQKRNDALFTPQKHLSNVVTAKKDLPKSAAIDLVVASITLKYTQSNSVSYALGGQVIGVGAGQQSRVDCVKLAGRKVAVWQLRQHPKVLGLKFRKGVKRQERVNARVRYIEGDMTAPERKVWEALFDEVPAPLTDAEKSTFLASTSGVSLSSDAFFPFRDSIDHASKLGVQYVAQPGGSRLDDVVVKACDEYNMVMAFSGVRLFHH